MTQCTGHMMGLYNLVADNKADIILLFSDTLSILPAEIRVTLRHPDISAQVIINSSKVKEKCGTKIAFLVNRLDEYETFTPIEHILPLLSTMIKIKDRGKKITKIQSQILL